MRIKYQLLSAVALASAAATPAAAIINAPVPVNATIFYAGLQWAWASPLDFSSLDLSYQSTQGWRLPTAAELTNAPSAMLFKYAGANVPLNGSDPVSGANWQFTSATLDSDAALATPYFSDFYLHGDWCNGVGSACGFGEVPWAGQPGAPFYAESLVVRGISATVPEPASWALMVVGFGLAGSAMRRRVALSA